MCKFLCFGKKLGATGATAATKRSITCSITFPQCSSTVASLHCTLNWLLSRLKTSFYSLVCSSSSTTSPNFAQEKELLRESVDISPSNDEFHHSWEFGDEFDHEDYDEWWEDNCEEWWDGPVFNQRGKCWEQEAVNEAIEEEQDNGYRSYHDRTGGDIPF